MLKGAQNWSTRIVCDAFAYAKFRSNRFTFVKKRGQIKQGQLPQTESAHLTWLCRTVAVQKTFQSETVQAWIASVTKTCVQWLHLLNQYKTTSHFRSRYSSAAFDSFRPVFNTKLETTKFGSQETRWILCHTVLIYWLRIISFCHSPHVWQTDRRMDGWTDRRQQQQCDLTELDAH